MRLVLVMLGLLATVLLASACGGQPGGAGRGGGEAPPPTIDTAAPPTPPSGGAPESEPDRPTPAPDPLTASPPPGTTVVPAERVELSGVVPGFPTLVWARDGRVLGMYGRAGGCTEARAELLDQDAAAVTVRVVQYRTGPEPCTRDLRYPALEVTLEEDLGNRRVVLRSAVR